MDKMNVLYAKLTELISELTVTHSPSDDFVTECNQLLDDAKAAGATPDIERFRITPGKYQMQIPGFSKPLWKYTDVMNNLMGLDEYLKSHFAIKPVKSAKERDKINNAPNRGDVTSLTINQTLPILIEGTNNPEEKTKLIDLYYQLNKPVKDWNSIKNSLQWIIGYSQDLSLQIMPIVLKAFRK